MGSRRHLPAVAPHRPVRAFWRGARPCHRRGDPLIVAMIGGRARRSGAQGRIATEHCRAAALLIRAAALDRPAPACCCQVQSGHRRRSVVGTAHRGLERRQPALAHVFLGLCRPRSHVRGVVRSESAQSGARCQPNPVSSGHHGRRRRGLGVAVRNERSACRRVDTCRLGFEEAIGDIGSGRRDCTDDASRRQRSVT